MKIQIIMGSTRPSRVCQNVAEWVQLQAKKILDETYEIIDLGAYNLPFLDEPIPAKMGIYQRRRYGSFIQPRTLILQTGSFSRGRRVTSQV